MHKNFQVIVGTSLTHQEQKDTFANSTAHGRLIVLLFHRFEIASCPHPKKITPSTELIQYAFSGSALPTGANTQRTNPSLQVTKSSGIIHF